MPHATTPEHARATSERQTRRLLDTSAKLDLTGVDWSAAARAGLSDDERFTLTYFADVEGQTIVYLREALHTTAALEPDTVAFLTLWNYEEYFHGEALARLLAVCGQPLGSARVREVRAAVPIGEAIEAAATGLLSRLAPDAFATTFMAWGALQELTTLRGYERLAATTANPALREIALRIARQERRHYAWYHARAARGLAGSAVARHLARSLLARFWSPVGAGVKGDAAAARVIRFLFPGADGAAVAHGVDERIGRLPGLADLGLLGRYVASVAEDGAASAARHHGA